jgi:chromate transporter
VGFVGAWTKQLFGPEAVFLAGAMGAIVATFFTFLPSFLFILAGGPFIESTRDDVKLTAPLAAITSAVVGVVVNLAVFFAWRVFWPASTEAAPFSGGFEPAAAVITAVGLVALVARGVGVIPVVFASGLAGLALWALGLQGAI